MSSRIRTPDGDWYVATSDRDWPAAIERSNQASRERRERMASWEAEHHPGCYPDSSYWDAYRAEKYRIVIEWPMPSKHVMFNRKGEASHV